MTSKINSSGSSVPTASSPRRTPRCAELGKGDAFGPYEILGVEPGSEWPAIKQAYIRLSQEHHPDKGGDQSQMQKITEAYTELKLIYS